MKIQHKVTSKTIIEVEGDDVKEVFKALAWAVDVFGQDKCGACGSAEVVPVHRNAKGYDFYELQCRACQAKLSFGQFIDGGGLFPKRKDKEGRPIGKNGWHVYQPQRNDDEGAWEG